VSLRSVWICVVDDKGEVCLEAKVAAEIDAIVDRLRRFSSEVKLVGFEAGTLTQYLTYGLHSAGFEVICLEARQVSVTLSAMRNKTDRNDARGLGQILRTGWYSRVHVKSLHSHQVRALLASRKAILRKCVDLENELRGLLKVFGIRLPSGSDTDRSTPSCARRCRRTKCLPALWCRFWTPGRCSTRPT
jgi:transposase